VHDFNNLSKEGFNLNLTWSMFGYANKSDLDEYLTTEGIEARKKLLC